ncbi:uncharacterized protein EV422DRAFT_382912 [Fimicolochytrium jonesii]|uniref:uncharacterized protein n=1 Tax=Fimicolochytrium jonesii TaxID=1396493 RepID=UPI0022FEFB00|nr:uncharacterized protein EV422DRAFT_382912 [Fimicolochytrium jonesii]KAI8822886.1 hypothetical protein EV422DRAFT_382912 [Fimicolochytrium jonesii]
MEDQDVARTNFIGIVPGKLDILRDPGNAAFGIAGWEGQADQKDATAEDGDYIVRNPLVLNQAYAGLPAKLTRTFVTHIIFITVIIIFSLFLLRDAVHTNGERAKQKMRSACAGLEIGATAMASIPHYAADGLNRATVNSINAIVSHTTAMLVGAVQLLNSLIIMTLQKYTSLLFCLLDIVVKLTVGTVSQYAGEITDFLNVQLAGIKTALENSLGMLNEQIQNFESALGDAVQTIAGIFGGTVDANVFAPVSFPGVISKLDFTIPTSFVDELKGLYDKVPKFTDLEKQLEALISTPFVMLENLIEQELGGLTGFSSGKVLIAAPDAYARVEFCDGAIHYDWVDTIVAAIDKALLYGLYLVIAFASASILGNIVVTTYEHWKFNEEVKRFAKVLQNHQYLNEQLAMKAGTKVNKHQFRAVSRDLIHAATRPTMYRFTRMLTRLVRSEKASIRLRWFLDYVSHAPSLQMFMAGVLGCAVIYLQLRMIETIKDETAAMVASGAASTIDAMVMAVDVAMLNVAAPYIAHTNGAIKAVEDLANDKLFGWVNTTVDAIDNALGVFVNGLDSALGDVFGEVPVLSAAMNQFVMCVLGSNMATLDAMAAGFKASAHISFPRVNTTDLVGVSQAAIRIQLINAAELMESSAAANTSTAAANATVANGTATSTSATATGTAMTATLKRRSDDTTLSNSTKDPLAAYFEREIDDFLDAYRASLKVQILPYLALLGFGSIVIIMGLLRLFVWVIADCIRDCRKAYRSRSHMLPKTSRFRVNFGRHLFGRFGNRSGERKMKQRPSGDSLATPPSVVHRADSELGSDAGSRKDRGAAVTEVLRRSLLFPHLAMPDANSSGSHLIPNAVSSPPPRARTALAGPRPMNEFTGMKTVSDFPALQPRPNGGPQGPRAMNMNLDPVASSSPRIGSPNTSTGALSSFQRSQRQQNRPLSALFTDSGRQTPTGSESPVPTPAILEPAITHQFQFKLLPHQSLVASAPLSASPSAPSAPPPPIPTNQQYARSPHPGLPPMYSPAVTSATALVRPSLRNSNRQSWHPYNNGRGRADSDDEDEWDDISREAAAAVAMLAAKARRGV